MAIKETIKNLFEKVLTIGTPPKKEVLYKEVVKRKAPKESAEKLVLNDIKNSVKKVFSHEDDSVEFMRGTPNPPVKKVAKKKTPAKKTSTKKTTTKKTSTTKKTTTTIKKKTTPSKTKTTETKKTTTKKTPAKKVATQEALAKKETVTKTTSKKATTKTSSTKKPATKKSSDTKAATVKKKATPATKTTSDKKTTIKKKVATKKALAAKKSPAPAKSSKRDEKIALYIKDIKKHYGEVDESFVAIIVKNLGPAIYRRDAELVSCSDPKELDTVRRNFLVKKLGIDASKGVLDAAIQDVCTELKGVRTKYRATFYYSLAKKFKKESVLS